MQSVVLQLDGLSGVFWFFLLLLIGVLIALFAMAIGGIIVAGLSLPALFVLPTVRRPLITSIESIRDVRVESIMSWRFIGVYLLFIYAYGVSLIFFAAWLAESIGTIQGLIYSWQADLLAAFVAAITIGAGTLLFIRRVGPEKRLRAVVECIIFLGFVDGLILIAAIFVPWGIGDIILRLLYL